MIERYEDTELKVIWSDKNKLALWQDVELAVILAMENLGQINKGIHRVIVGIFFSQPIDLEWWLQRESEVRHDLNAFIDERSRFLPLELQQYLHKKITSYDTEEPAFAGMVKKSIEFIEAHCHALRKTLAAMAQKYRYTIMNGRTHGQEAELQTFGKRCLTWLRDLQEDMNNLERAKVNLKYSKLSGAIGNYGSIDPNIEKEALKILGFEPYYGATQIMPREIYASVAGALCQIVLTLDKIATAIRLGARSGRPIYQEPFGKKQKGSSAMPHKKNTISSEQIEGMARMAQGYLAMIMANIKTWEERAIEQSCVERVAWPDLFHVVVHSLKTMNRVLSGLVVYPDNMLLEIVDSHGCYASSEVKELLKGLGVNYGLTAEDAYRIVQLAAFNAFEPTKDAQSLREFLPKSFIEVNALLWKFQDMPRIKPVSIQDIIKKAELMVSPQLDASEQDVERWNGILQKIFQDSENLERWNEIFLPSYLLRNEAKLYQEILGI